MRVLQVCLIRFLKPMTIVYFWISDVRGVLWCDAVLLAQVSITFCLSTILRILECNSISFIYQSLYMLQFVLQVIFTRRQVIPTNYLLILVACSLKLFIYYKWYWKWLETWEISNYSWITATTDEFKAVKTWQPMSLLAAFQHYLLWICVHMHQTRFTLVLSIVYTEK